MKVKSTTDYGIFKFREDNREKIDKAHVRKIAESIQARNLLEMRPIMVNADMEIMDGQHRLLAAQSVGVAIYYQMKEELQPEDIILMNISKSWGSVDYLNYYVRNGYPEYVKLKEFMKTNNIALKIALGLTMGKTWENGTTFRKGEYKFASDSASDELQICWDTINYIKKMNGYSAYTSSGRFWKAMVKLVKHSLFDKEKWKTNLERMIDKMGPRARTEDYMHLLSEIHNWRNSFKIDLKED